MCFIAGGHTFDSEKEDSDAVSDLGMFGNEDEQLRTDDVEQDQPPVLSRSFVREAML